METTNEILKSCIICSRNLTLECFRPKRRVCRQCVYKREEQTQKELLRLYYLKNRDEIIIKQVKYYNEKTKGQIKKVTKPRKHFFDGERMELYEV